jgi:uncharacterized protein YndB with AHSA1/START domain
MNNLHFSIEIQAPKQRVWDVMLTKETYQQWTEPFHPGSTFEGSWEEGSEIHFVSTNSNEAGGMICKVVVNKPYEYISLETLGEIVNGKLNTDTASLDLWAGAHENYTFGESNGTTTLTVDLLDGTMPEEMMKMFEQMWPQALKKLKQIVEG